MKTNGRTSALTFDIEDGLSLAMRDVFNRQIPQSDRVYRTTREILDLLWQNNVKGTFFTLGIVARDFPQLIKEIVREGHELAVHGFNHYRVFKLTRQEFANELKLAKDVMEQISGHEVLGHRAPAFSVNRNTPWAFEVLAELGFRYDSSVMPRASEYHGICNFPNSIAEIQTASGTIIEFPISTISFLGSSIPFSGGSYMRLLPEWVLNKAFAHMVQKEPAVLYMHPYEFDRVPYPDYYFTEMKKVSLLTQLKLRANFINRGSSLGKLKTLIRNYDFDTMKKVIENQSEITKLPKNWNGA